MLGMAIGAGFVIWVLTSVFATATIMKAIEIDLGDAALGAYGTVGVVFLLGLVVVRIFYW